LDSKARLAACLASEASLSRTIAQLQPAMIATLLRSIEGNVARSVSRAHWDGPFLHLPYPGRWSSHREKFADALVPVLGGLIHKRT
jgi:hypothetical protein